MKKMDVVKWEGMHFLQGFPCAPFCCQIIDYSSPLKVQNEL